MLFGLSLDQSVFWTFEHYSCSGIAVLPPSYRAFKTLRNGAGLVRACCALTCHMHFTYVISHNQTYVADSCGIGSAADSRVDDSLVRWHPGFHAPLSTSLQLFLTSAHFKVIIMPNRPTHSLCAQAPQSVSTVFACFPESCSFLFFPCCVWLLFSANAANYYGCPFHYVFLRHSQKDRISVSSISEDQYKSSFLYIDMKTMWLLVISYFINTGLSLTRLLK